MALMDEYLGLVTSQHRVHEKFMRTVTALLTPSDDIFALAIELDDDSFPKERIPEFFDVVNAALPLVLRDLCQ